MKSFVFIVLAFSLLTLTLTAQAATKSADAEAEVTRQRPSDAAASKTQTEAKPDNSNPSHIATDAGHLDTTDPVPPTDNIDGTDAKTDISDLSPEDLKARSDLMQEKLKEFQTMQNFFCFMAIKKYVNEKKTSLEPLVKLGGSKAAQKLIASLFTACQADSMEEETMDQLMNVKSREEAEALQFPFYKSFDLPAFIDKKDFEITADDKVNLKLFDEVQKKFEKMSKDSKAKKDKSDSGIDEEDEDVSDKKKTDGKKKKRASVEYSWWIKYPIFAGVIGLVVLLAKLAIKSTGEPAQKLRKKDERKEKKKL